MKKESILKIRNEIIIQSEEKIVIKDINTFYEYFHFALLSVFFYYLSNGLTFNWISMVFFLLLTLALVWLSRAYRREICIDLINKELNKKVVFLNFEIESTSIDLDKYEIVINEYSDVNNYSYAIEAIELGLNGFYDYKLRIFGRLDIIDLKKILNFKLPFFLSIESFERDFG